MPRFFKTRSHVDKSPPGSLVPSPEEALVSTEVTLINYNEMTYNEVKISNILDCVPYMQDESTLSWVKVVGLSNTDLLSTTAKLFKIDPIFLEDVLNLDHRPKVEELENFMFTISKALVPSSETTGFFDFEQVSLFMGDGFVVSFEERPSPLFESIQNRISQKTGKIRTRHADYLLYALLDRVVDTYFSKLEELGSSVEDLNESLGEKESRSIPIVGSRLDTDLLYFRKSAVPIKDTLSQILKTNRKDIKKETLNYFKDIHDHTVQIVDTVTYYRDLLKSIQSSYSNDLNQRTNDVMKTLTLFASLFIPLTFIVGIYGMNFKYMPELNMKYGYYGVWGVMLLTAGSLFIYFKKKHFL